MSNKKKYIFDNHDITSDFRRYKIQIRKCFGSLIRSIIAHFEMWQNIARTPYRKVAPRAAFVVDCRVVWSFGVNKGWTSRHIESFISHSHQLSYALTALGCPSRRKVAGHAIAPSLINTDAIGTLEERGGCRFSARGHACAGRRRASWAWANLHAYRDPGV